METRLESADSTQIERQEVEKERSIGLGRQRDHLSLLLLVGLVEDLLKIGGLPA